MRTKDTLLALGNIAILFQYLYISEDHAITFNNELTDLRIRVDERCTVLCQNLSFPGAPETDFSEQMTLDYTLNVIEILKTMPPEKYKGMTKDRWDEIKTVTQCNLALNED